MSRRLWWALTALLLSAAALSQPSSTGIVGGGGGIPTVGTITATHCAEWQAGSPSPALEDSGGGCGGSPNFSTIGAGTNANALVIGTGGSLTVSGSGTNNATTLGGATFAAPGAIGGGTAAAGTFTALTASSTVTFGGISGSTQCLHASSAGVVTGTGSDCGSGGSTAFSGLTSGTNTTAAMVVGTGASLQIGSGSTLTLPDASTWTSSGIAATGSNSLNFNVPTGQGYDFQVNGSNKHDFGVTNAGDWTFSAPVVMNAVSFTGQDSGTWGSGGINGSIIGATTAEAGHFTTVNGNTFTAGTYTLTGTAGKTLTFSNSLTLAGTDSTTMTFPAASDTVAGIGTAETWTAAQTFTNSDIKLLGSSTGATTFTSANGSATNYTMTVPAATDTLVVLGATQTLTNKTLTTPTASALTLSDVATGTQCLHANGSGVVSGTGADCSTAATFISFGAGSQAQALTDYYWYQESSASVGNVGGLAPVTGHLKNLYYAAVNAPASGQPFTITVNLGAVGSVTTTALTCTVSNPAKTCNDTSDSVAITAGQQYNIEVVTAATSGTTGIQYLGVELTVP